MHRVTTDNLRVIPSWWQLLLFAGMLVAYNIAISFLSGWQQWVAIAVFLAFIVLVIRWWRLAPIEIGLGKSTLRKGFQIGILMSGIVALVMLTIFLIHPVFFSDTRYSNTNGIRIIGSLLYMLVHTVLIEELVFRGIIFGVALRRLSVWHAAFISSVLFGLWHIAPSLHITESSTAAGALPTGSLGAILAIVGIVIATSFAGLLFCYARFKSGSLLAPIMVHWTINGVGLILAVMSV